MGKSDPYLRQVYNALLPKGGDIALLGFTDNSWSPGDLYDLQLNNWSINSEWGLPKKYDSIISTRCPYFAKDPQDFIKRCYENLNDDGQIFLDWGLGDHWRYDNFKVGWVKDGEHESAYQPDNHLWSTLWDDSFLSNPQFVEFKKLIQKFDYKDLKSAIFEEVPVVLELDFVKKYFDVSYTLLTLNFNYPIFYIFLYGNKKSEY
tara:strand:+ start:334 stop:945 length:612 start_codon:yes stop_codon:yes gene_type:complete